MSSSGIGGSTKLMIVPPTILYDIFGSWITPFTITKNMFSMLTFSFKLLPISTLTNWLFTSSEKFFWAPSCCVLIESI